MSVLLPLSFFSGISDTDLGGARMDAAVDAHTRPPPPCVPDGGRIACGR